MKKLILLLFALTSNNSFGAIPVQIIDGKVNFAKAIINGTAVFIDKEVNDYLAISTAIAPSIITPTGFETTLSTSGLKFSSASDFKESVDIKNYLDNKIDDLKVSESKNYKLSLDYLKSENAKK